jgi:hypothetical protein
MAARSKPRCFIAMAFDRRDTDELYEKSIQPILKSNSIVPVIINRREDNRDINHQIIEQLNTCDFAIADLTYTRPSVYFEAGYAQRAVEVIYTVRADHLKQNQPDDKRVHFDLQMKPLVKWRTPTDKAFQKGLERRLRGTVLREWNHKLEQDSQEKRSIAEFTSMPLQKRLWSVRRLAVRELHRLGFETWTVLLAPRSPVRSSYTYRQIFSELSKYRWIMSQTRAGRTSKVVSIWVEESLTLTQLRDKFGHSFLVSSYPPHLDGYRMSEEKCPIKKTEEHHILCSLKPVPQTRIMSALPTLHWHADTRHYSTETTYKHKGTRNRTTKKGLDWVEYEFSVERMVSVYCISGIKSMKHFTKEAAQVLEYIDSKKQQHMLRHQKSRKRVV